MRILRKIREQLWVIILKGQMYLFTKSFLENFLESIIIISASEPIPNNSIYQIVANNFVNKVADNDTDDDDERWNYYAW